MRRRLRVTTAEAPRVRTCGRCGFTLPLAYFDGKRGTCTECWAGAPVPEKVASAAADYALRCNGALSLLRLGLSVAAAEVLAGDSWPSLEQAREMQARKAA